MAKRSFQYRVMFDRDRYYVVWASNAEAAVQRARRVYKTLCGSRAPKGASVYKWAGEDYRLLKLKRSTR